VYGLHPGTIGDRAQRVAVSPLAAGRPGQHGGADPDPTLYYGWTQVATTGGSPAVQVVVAVPFDPQCGATASQSQAIDQVVPLGSGQGLVAHAPVGPVQALQALPSG
jgi:hypothetical protein